jgi:BirA family biotin operon repressor/biotin-[acetyl-CoA-carboxylase] ligase
MDVTRRDAPMTALDVRYYDTIGSTNDEALRLAQAGVGHGTVVWAREQTAGRGRQGRHWHSPDGNLYASILLRPGVPPGRISELSFVAALAVGDTVDQFLADDTRAALKWPNDVLVRGGKIAGILLEAAADAVVIGIGINLQSAPPGAPYPVTCLADHVAAAPKPAAALRVLLGSIAGRQAAWLAEGFAATRLAWLSRAHPPGTPIRAGIGEHAVAGRFAGLAEDGALIVETADGPVRIVAGDVVAAGGI